MDTVTVTVTPSMTATASETAACTAPARDPECDANANNTALAPSGGQYYRVVCGGHYEATTNLTSTLHPRSYRLAECVEQCATYNDSPSPPDVPCSMVRLIPEFVDEAEESSGNPPSQERCLLSGGEVGETFYPVPNQGWESGIFLSNETAIELACGFRDSSNFLRFR